MEIANFVVLVRRVDVFHAAAQRVMREIDHRVVDGLGLFFQAQRLHVQNEHQHEAHGTCAKPKTVDIRTTESVFSTRHLLTGHHAEHGHPCETARRVCEQIREQTHQRQRRPRERHQQAQHQSCVKPMTLLSYPEDDETVGRAYEK